MKTAGSNKPNASEGKICMSDHGSEPLSEALHRQRVLSRWDNEGGAETDGPQAAADADEGQLPFPRIDDAEFGALHVRVIALENLVIALLAAASDRELDAARNMASYISPRPGFTHHPLTVHAAGHMTNLIDRGYPFP